MERLKGKIIKWNRDGKGYGFVGETGSSYFIHITKVTNATDEEKVNGLQVGVEVEYTCEQTPKGIQAVNALVLSRVGSGPTEFASDAKSGAVEGVSDGSLAS